MGTQGTKQLAPEANMIRSERELRGCACGEHVGRDQHIHAAGFGINANDVAVGQASDGTGIPRRAARGI